MGGRAKDERIEACQRFCRENGMALTPQRRAIPGAVLDLDDHPTADRVHAALARRRVRVSRATVFRTLESLSCDRVIDFSDARLDALPVPDTRHFGFVVSDFRVQLRGICKACREQEDK